jgi:hypothetical protein
MNNCDYCFKDRDCYLHVINKRSGATATFCSLDCLCNSTIDAINDIAIEEKPWLSSLKPG